jgi:SAM-dependent methyltransferase
MSEPDVEYRGLIAEFWDLLRGDTSGWADRPFWRDAILRSGQPALDVGCGTGRLLLDYLSQGLQVDGVDNSPEMLAICRRKAAELGLRPNLYQQTMEELDLPGRYGTIFVPSSSFQLVLEPAAALEALRRFHHHLRPGGELTMSLMVLGPPGASEEWALVRERTRPSDGATVRRWGRSWFDRAAQLEHTEDRYEVWRGEEMIASELHRRSPATRWYTQSQAVELLERAGFVDVRLQGGFTDRPATPDDDPLFTIFGRRPT